jgi:hypothetical protein
VATVVGAEPSPVFQRTSLGLRIEGGLSYEAWQEVGRQLASSVSASAWWVGDWAFYGEWQYGSRYRDAIEVTGLDYPTVKNYAWVAGTFDYSRRRERLSFSHHKAVAALRPEEQDKWLDAAEEQGWSKTELEAEVQAANAAKSHPGETIEQPPPAARIELSLSWERKARYANAAEAKGLSLDTWIVETLDLGAAAILGD